MVGLNMEEVTDAGIVARSPEEKDDGKHWYGGAFGKNDEHGDEP